MIFSKRILTLFLCAFHVLAGSSLALAMQTDPSMQTDLSTNPVAVQGAHVSTQELQQLVAPIALYPDELAAEILAASTYPDQVVEADRWVQQHSDLKDQALANEVDKQPWDSSVKALAPFPSVLANMDKNLSWTSSLGEAYVNQQTDVMKAIQTMRKRAQKAGNLASSAEQKVATQGQTIVIEPSQPEVVYVPQYDPWLAYGEPLAMWPGWYAEPGIFYEGPSVFWGSGFGIGFFGGFGWGFHHWGLDWRHHDLLFDHERFYSHSATFIHRDRLGNEHADFNHHSAFRSDGHDGNHMAHGFTEPQHNGSRQPGIGEQHGASRGQCH